MADSLAKNPIALRQCLLYEFLQGKCAQKALDDVSQTVGKNVMNKEQTQIWFRRFAKGKFYKNRKKHDHANVKDIFQSDKKALRTSILYLSLKSSKKNKENPEEVPDTWCEKHDLFRFNPSFVMYEEFRKVIAEDFMEYREFDFWLHRFWNGEYDLDFERDKDKKIYELLDMPIDIMKKIVEYLNIFDRLSLEKTSQSLRSFSQDQKVYHGGLTFGADRHSIYMSFGVGDLIEFKNEGDDCEVEFRNSKKLLRGVSYLKQAFQDFEKILENPKLYLHTLTITISPWCEDRILLEEQMEGALKFTNMLHVQHLSLRTRSMKALLNILPSLKPGYLTTIALNIDLDEATIGKLVKMDQWKQAKHLEMGYNLFLGPLRHLYHFHEFTIAREELLIDDVRGMKEILFDSPNFEGCILCLDIPVKNSDDPMVIRRVFGGPIEGSNDIFHYPIPKSTDYFEIRVNFNVNFDIMKIERKKK